MTDSQTSQVGPAICYQEVEALPEQQRKVDLAFDLLFEEVLRAGFSYPRSPQIPLLTTMDN